MTYQNVRSVTARKYISEKMVHYLAVGAGMIHVMKSDIMEYKNISIDQLEISKIRDIRDGVLKTLEERISNSGYNPAKPLSVIEHDGKYIVADGAHRLTVIQKMGITEVPCVIYDDGTDLYKLGVKCNQDEDTYAPMDLFDYLDVIGTLKEHGCTQEVIGEKIGWERGKIAKYDMILDSVVPENLELAKSVQTGRGTNIVPNGTIEFTEGWFREILKLNSDNQHKIIHEYIDTKGKLKGQKLTAQVDKLILHEEMIQYVDLNLLDGELKENFSLDINNGLYKTIKSLEAAIQKSNDAFKERNQIQIIQGDAFDLFKTIPDKSIDCIVCDPPYNVTEHEWDKFSSDEEFFAFIENILVDSRRVLKDDYQFYLFCSSKYQADIELMVRKYFDIKSRIIWVRRNMSMGRTGTNKFLQIYDMVFHCGNTDLNFPSEWGSERFDVQEVAVPQSNFKDKKVHPTQKPMELIRSFVELSTHIGDQVLDPFAGSGTTVVACKKLKRQCIAFEQDVNYIKIMESRLNE